MSATSLHPLLDNGITPGKPDFGGGLLRCHCASDPVTVRVASDVLHNHACGCSKCWKPAGALFSVIGVAPAANVSVVSGGEHLHVVDEAAAVSRNACRRCGVHLFSRAEKEHPFEGLTFVHVELSEGKGKEGWQAPQFAAFVSSVIETGFDPHGVDAVRKRFEELGLETYDVLSPPLMDAIATWTAKQKGVLPQDE